MQVSAFVVVEVHCMSARPANEEYNFIHTPMLSSSWIDGLSMPTGLMDICYHIHIRALPIWSGTAIACNLTITTLMSILVRELHLGGIELTISIYSCTQREGSVDLVRNGQRQRIS